MLEECVTAPNPALQGPIFYGCALSDRADLRLKAGRLTAEQIEGIAMGLAAFHKSLDSSPEAAEFAGANKIRQNIDENFAALRESLPCYLDRRASDALRAWQRKFVDEHERSLERRIAQGHVREAHGDLRLDRIYLRDDGEMLLMDSGELDQRHRVADVCTDTIALAIDLSLKGRTDLAESLLAAYACESNDFEIYSMADFYASYLAFHRGSSIGTAAKSSGASRRPAQLEARSHFMLALAASRAALLPAHLVAVGGVMATGKTTVAGRISREMSAPLLSADRLRRYLAGVAEHPSTREASFGALYSADLAERTYSELIRRADIVLRSGRSVVLDASFRPRWSRTLARDLADACRVAFRFVECTVDYNLCLDRLARRPRQQAEIDGRAGIYQDFIERWEPIVELSPAQHLRIDTSIPLCRNMATLRAQIAMWPRAFPAQR